MKKYVIIAIIVPFVLLLLGNVSFWGPKGFVNIGDTYNQFGIIPAKSVSFSIRFRSNYTGSLSLVDENGMLLTASDYKIWVDGKASGPSFRGNGTKNVNVTMRCSSTLRAGRKYIMVSGGGPYVSHYFFTHHMNPLLCWLTWIVMLMLLVCFVWFLFLRNMVYPKFKRFSKYIYVDGYAPVALKANGERMIVIGASRKLQSVWDVLVKGRIQYIEHPFFVHGIVLRPKSKGKMLMSYDYTKYVITPNPMKTIGATNITFREDKNINVKIQ